MATCIQPDPWQYWTTTGTTAVTAGANDAWLTWADNTAGTTDMTWTTWTVAYGSGNETATSLQTANTWLTWAVYGQNGLVEQGTPYVDQRTDEQRAADEARYAAQRAEVQRQADARLAATKAATERARTLLLAMLTVQQREQLQREQFFDVVAKASQRRYRIRQGSHGNVYGLDEKGNMVRRYCAQPTGVPIEDSMLAQKLQLEHDEEAFLRVANVLTH